MLPDITKEPEVSADDEFTASFAQFGIDEQEKPAEPVATAEPVTTEAQPVVPAADVAPAVEPTETPAVETPEAPATEPTANDDLLERLAKLVRQPEEKAPETPAPQPETPAPEIYTKDEQEFLSTYEKEWPDVARAETLRRRAEYVDLLNHVFSEVGKELGPLMQQVRSLAERSQLADLYTVVEDYDDVREKVIEWAEKQPSYLQSAYKQVIQQGTPEEVADLVARYKKEAMPAAPAVAPPKVETELPTPAKQAAAALAPVGSQRTTVVVADDPSDFDSAFAAAAKTL